MEMSRSVCILIPASRYISNTIITSFGFSISAAQELGFGVSFFVSDLGGFDNAREKLLSDALALNPVPMYLLWLDTDIRLTEEQAKKLMEFMETHPEADAASGLYFNQTLYRPVCMRRVEGKLCTFCPGESEPVEIDAAGMGCMIIRTRSIIEKLLPSKGENRLFLYDLEKQVGEDTYFCNLMEKAGMKLYVVPDACPLHYGGYVGRKHFEKLF